MSDRVIQGVNVEPDGSLQISNYHPDTDVTQSGVVQLHTLLVPIGGQYDDEIAAVLDAINHLVADVLEDFEDLPKLGET